MYGKTTVYAVPEAIVSLVVVYDAFLMLFAAYPEVRAPVTSSTVVVTSIPTSAPIDTGVVEWPPDDGTPAGGPSSSRVPNVAVSTTDCPDEFIADKSMSFPLRKI